MSIYELYMSSRSVTQSQIALESGISQSAVSAILAGSTSRRLSAETREKVLEVAEKLGYLGRKASLTRKTDEVAGKQTVLMIENEPDGRVTNEEWMRSAYESFMGKILTTAGRCLQKHDIGLSAFHFNDPQKLTQWLADSDVGGILWHAKDSNSALLHWVASRFPMVLLNRDWAGSVPFDSVSVDQEKNIRVAADYLWSLGHRRIATFGHSSGDSFYRRRMNAYRQFIEERNLRNYTEFQEISDAPEIPALEKVQEIIDVWRRLGSEAPTALITSDVFALPLLREAKSAGIAIPDDLSIVGIDNTVPCSLVDPPLTSMEESFEEMSRLAVDLLLRRKANPSEPSLAVQIAPRLVARSSVARVSESAVAR